MENYLIEEIPIEQIVNYKDYINLHCFIRTKYPLWNAYLLNEYDIYKNSCRNCKKIYLKFSDKIFCSLCNIIIKDEIDNFEKFINENYSTIQNKHGVNNRIKLIMFSHRKELLNKDQNKYSIYLYNDKINLCKNNFVKLLYTIYKNDNDLSYYNYHNYQNCSSFDKKLMKALKK